MTKVCRAGQAGMGSSAPLAIPKATYESCSRDWHRIVNPYVSVQVRCFQTSVGNVVTGALLIARKRCLEIGSDEILELFRLQHLGFWAEGEDPAAHFVQTAGGKGEGA